MKIFNQKNVTAVLVFAILALPLVTFSAGLIPDCKTEYVDGKLVTCGFNDLVKLANNIIKFLLYGVAIPLAAIGFMVQGARMVLSGDKAGARTEAKAGLVDIGKGFGYMLGSYVLIKIILFAFVSAPQKAFIQFLIN